MRTMINHELIKLARKSKKLSQGALVKLVTDASGIDLTQQSLSKIEKGETEQSAALPFICNALDLSYEEVTGLPGDAALTSGKRLFDLLNTIPEQERNAFFKLMAMDNLKHNNSN